MKNLFYLLLTLLAPAQSLVAQPAPAAAPATRIISGRVQDSTTGEALPGVTVQLKGTSIGTTTDMEGRYTLAGVPTTGAILVVRFIGYAALSQPVPTPSPASLDVKLVSEPPLLSVMDDGIIRRRALPMYSMKPVMAANIARKPAKPRQGRSRAATRTISGRVTDAQGQALPGATVQLKGTKTSATTNATGFYILAGVPMAESALLVSRDAGRFIGQELPVAAGTTRLDVLLQRDCAKPVGGDPLGGPK